MKSLNDNPVIHKTPEIFTDEILKWLASEGFGTRSNDSYFEFDDKYPYESQCFYKNASEGTSFHVGIYIFSFGIVVDVDYDCGGNMSGSSWKFSNYSFEEAYSEMVDYVNRYKE